MNLQGQIIKHFSLKTYLSSQTVFGHCLTSYLISPAEITGRTEFNENFQSKLLNGTTNLSLPSWVLYSTELWIRKSFVSKTEFRYF